MSFFFKLFKISACLVTWLRVAHQIIVGVNKYQSNDADGESVDVLKIDNEKVIANQLNRLQKIKASRDESAVARSLQALSDAAASKERNISTNLLSRAVDCARARATLGEITDAMERVFGRHTSNLGVVSGIYSGEFAGEQCQSDDGEIERVREAVKQFEEDAGRRPRILVAKLGQVKSYFCNIFFSYFQLVL